MKEQYYENVEKIKWIRLIDKFLNSNKEQDRGIGSKMRILIK